MSRQSLADLDVRRPELQLPAGRRIRIADVVAAAARASQLTRWELLSHRRDRHLVRWRQAAMEVAAQATTASLPAIGRAFDRDHTTVLWGRHVVASRIAGGCAETRGALDAICANLDAPPLQPPLPLPSRAGAPPMTHDPVNAPSHYRGASGIQSIDITHAYRLGPDLTQAVDYILRAGRKTLDPRQDLAKAAFYLRYAASHGRDLVFGEPDTARPTAAEVAADFGIGCCYRALALAEILTPHPKAARLEVAAGLIDRASEVFTASLLPAANTGRAA